MINLLRSDFASNRQTAILLAAIVVLGMACWFPALAARGMPGSTHQQRTSVSVLSDPFANGHKQ